MYYPIFTKDVILYWGNSEVKKIFDEIYNRCSESDRKGIGEFFDGTIRDVSDTYLKQKFYEIVERFGYLCAKKQIMPGFNSKIEAACFDFMKNYKEFLISTLLAAAKITAKDAENNKIGEQCVLICDILERIFSKILDPSKIQYSNELIKLLINFITRLESEKMLFPGENNTAFHTSLITTHRDKIEKLQTEVNQLKLIYAPSAAAALLNERVEELLNMIRSQIIARINPDMTTPNISISDLNLDYLKKSALEQCESHYKNNSNEKSIFAKKRSTISADNNKIEQLRVLLSETEDLKKICQKISARITKFNWAAFLINLKTDEMIDMVRKKLKSKSYEILDIASDPILKTEAGKILTTKKLIGIKFLNVVEFEKALEVVMDQKNRKIFSDEVNEKTSEIRINFDLTLSGEKNPSPMISEFTDKKDNMSIQEIKVAKEEFKFQEEIKKNIENEQSSTKSLQGLNASPTNNLTVTPTLQQRHNEMLEQMRQQNELQIQYNPTQQNVSSPSFIIGINNHNSSSTTQSPLQVVFDAKTPVSNTNEQLPNDCKNIKAKEEVNMKNISLISDIVPIKEPCFSLSCVIQ